MDIRLKKKKVNSIFPINWIGYFCYFSYVKLLRERVGICFLWLIWIIFANNYFLSGSYLHFVHSTAMSHFCIRKLQISLCDIDELHLCFIRRSHVFTFHFKVFIVSNSLECNFTYQRWEVFWVILLKLIKL